MKKLLLILLILLNTMVLNAFSADEQKVIKIGTVNYYHLDTNIQTLYLGYYKEKRKDIISIEYTHLDLDYNNMNKEGNMLNISYVLKLAYENEIKFGPKISYVKYDFNNYVDDYIKVGLYGAYDINNQLRIYGNLVLSDNIINRNSKDLNNIDFGAEFKKDRFTYSLNIETSASFNIHNEKIIDIFSSDEFHKILFSIGYKY